MYIDPTLISNMTESHVTVQSSHPLLNTKKPDFVIIQPSSDICDKLGDPDFRKIQLDVQQCLETAQDVISDNPNTQVFITCLPPRYDTEEASRSTDLWNNILVTEAFMHNNIHVVHQTGLECKTGKKRYERYKDGGFLLTQYGTKLLTKNIASKITKVLGQSFSLCSVSETCDNQKKFSEYLTENSDKIYGRRKQHFITKVLKAIMV